MASFRSPTNSPPHANNQSPHISRSGAFLPRPTWLCSGSELEKLIITASPEITIKLHDISANKNNSDLVETVLQRVLYVKAHTRKGKEKRASLESVDSHSGSPKPNVAEDAQSAIPLPNEYELLLARLHLAVEIQSLMVRWCQRGLEETRKTSLLFRPNANDETSRLGENEVGEETMLNCKMDLDEAEGYPEEGVGYLQRGTRSRSTSTTSSGTASTVDSHPAENDAPSDAHLHSEEQSSKRRKTGKASMLANAPPKLSLNTSTSAPYNSPSSALPVSESSPTAGSLKRKRGDLSITPSKYTPTTALPTPGTGVSPKSFRSFSDIPPTPLTGTSSGEKAPYLCPFHILNPSTHPECAEKRFPNPRKLKEHIWRWTRPFRCPTCNEGFGREKTRAIHCQQRKNPCKARPAPDSQSWNPSGSGNNATRNPYEGSKEQKRDQKIEAARSTWEIINILKEYQQEAEKEAKNESSNRSESGNSSQTSPHATSRQYIPGNVPSTGKEIFSSNSQAVIASSFAPQRLLPFNDPFQQSPNMNPPSAAFSSQQTVSLPRQHQPSQQGLQIPEIQVHWYDVNAMTSPESYTPQRVDFRSPSPAPAESYGYGSQTFSGTTNIHDTNRMDNPMSGFKDHNPSQVPFFQGSSQGHCSSGIAQKLK